MRTLTMCANHKYYPGMLDVTFIRVIFNHVIPLFLSESHVTLIRVIADVA
jgi:hypothetical protein